MLFEGKNGDHRALSDVYFIPRLKNSIISVGQLNEWDSKEKIKDSPAPPRCEGEPWPESVVHAMPRRRSPFVSPCSMTTKGGVGTLATATSASTLMCQLGRQDMVCSLPWLEHVEQLRDTCITMKHRHAPFPAKAN